MSTDETQTEARAERLRGELAAMRERGGMEDALKRHKAALRAAASKLRESGEMAGRLQAMRAVVEDRDGVGEELARAEWERAVAAREHEPNALYLAVRAFAKHALSTLSDPAAEAPCRTCDGANEHQGCALHPAPEVVPVARVQEVAREVMVEANAAVARHQGKGEPGSAPYDLAMTAAGGYAAVEQVLIRLGIPLE